MTSGYIVSTPQDLYGFPAQRTYTIVSDQQFWGGGYQTGTSADRIAPYPVLVGSSVDCALACQNTYSCVIFVFTADGSCYRISTPYTGTTTATGVVSGNVTILRQWTYQTNTRYWGGGWNTGSSADAIAPYPLALTTYQDCATACAHSYTCKTFILDSNTSCYLHSSAYTGSSTSSVHISGMITQQRTYTYAHGQRFWGGTYITGTSAEWISPYPTAVNTWSDCAMECVRSYTCRIYTFTGGVCYMHTGPYTGYTASADHISGNVTAPVVF